MADLLVSKVEFVRAADVERRGGLMGFATVTLDDRVELGSIAVRRTLGGKFELSFPVREDRRGRRHRVVRLLNPAEHEAVEAQVIAILRARGALR